MTASGVVPGASKIVVGKSMRMSSRIGPGGLRISAARGVSARIQAALEQCDKDNDGSIDIDDVRVRQQACLGWWRKLMVAPPLWAGACRAAGA